MKCFLCVLFFLTSNLFVSAQDWAPYNLNERFNYRTDTAHVISAVYFSDSTSVNGPDSIFYLNRIMTQTGQFAFINRPQYWQMEMLNHQNGDYQFVNPGNKILKTLSQVNDSWLFDSVLNINATLISVAESFVIDNLDSVKYFLLDNGDSILLSKHHGLIKFPIVDSGSQYLFLTGINGREIGELMPGFWNVFNFDVGDFLQYFIEDGTLSSPYGTYEYRNETIYGKILTANEVIYNKHVVRTAFNVTPFGTTQSTNTFDVNDTFRIADYLWLNNFYPHKPTIINDTYFDCNTTRYFDSAFSFSTLETINFYGALSDDTLWNPFLEPPYADYIFSEGFGLTYHHLRWLNQTAGISFHNKILNGCIKAGNLYGEILGIKKIIPDDSYISPTLFNDFISIKTQLHNPIIEISDITGRVVLKKILDNNSFINTENILSGFYIVRLSDNDHSYYQKIIKQ